MTRPTYFLPILNECRVVLIRLIEEDWAVVDVIEDGRVDGLPHIEHVEGEGEQVAQVDEEVTREGRPTKPHPATGTSSAVVMIYVWRQRKTSWKSLGVFACKRVVKLILGHLVHFDVSLRCFC